MVAILLLILKIIGIVLLTLLGLILVLVLLALFYPLRYRLTGDIPDMEHRRISLRVCWLLCVVRFSFLLDGVMEPQMCFRIFGIPIWRSPEKERNRKRYKARKEQTAQKDSDLEPDHLQELTQDRENDFSQNIEEYRGTVSENEYVPVEDVDENLSESPKRKLFSKVRSIWSFIRSLPDKVRRLKKGLHRKSKDLGTILGDENNRQAVKLIWGELISLLKRYGPKKVRADMNFGTEDPALTGQILAVLSLMPFLFGSGIVIQPDFNSKKIYVKGTFDIRGRIQACHILGSLIRLYKNQNIKRLLKRFIK
ncbi:MAG: DUF2953 domain-containing protein [Roseburia sp.]